MIEVCNEAKKTLLFALISFDFWMLQTPHSFSSLNPKVYGLTVSEIFTDRTDARTVVYRKMINGEGFFENGMPLA